MVTVTDQAGGPGELFRFQWWKDAGGYAPKPCSSGHPASAVEDFEFVPVGDGKGGLLDPAMVPCYPLHESRGIARTFAAVGDSIEEIAAFLSQYGLLWQDRPLTASTFRTLRDQVRQVLDEIDRCKRHATKKSWHEKAQCFENLRRWFNASLSETLVFRVEIAAANAPGKITSRRELRIVPNSLFSAIGLLLGHEIAGDIETAQCKECGRYFSRGRPFGERRKDAEFCTDECGQQWKNKSRAAQLGNARQAAKAAIKPRKCVHCGKSYTPKRRGSTHCGAAACKQAAYRLRQKEQHAEKSATAKPEQQRSRRTKK